jgi:hypothetical protein
MNHMEVLTCKHMSEVKFSIRTQVQKDGKFRKSAFEKGTILLPSYMLRKV